MKRTGTRLVIYGMLVCLTCWGCGSNSNQDLPTASIAGGSTGGSTSEAPTESIEPEAPLTSLAADDTYNAPQVNNVFREDVLEESQPEPFPEVMIRTSQGDIRLKLDAEAAPETVDNFLKNYVDRDYYSGTIFHFVDPAFIVMAGGYTPDLQRAEPRSPIRNESHNGRKNLRGTVGMSRHPEYADSATCEFYINVKDNPTLDHAGTEAEPVPGYCVFGEVVSGMDVVDRLASAPVKNEGNFVNLPAEAIVIQAIERVK